MYRLHNVLIIKREDFRNFLILSHVPILDPISLSLSNWRMYAFLVSCVDWIKTTTQNAEEMSTFLFRFVIIKKFFLCCCFERILLEIWRKKRYLFWALDGGVGHSFMSLAPIEIGVLGLVALLPDKQAVPSGEQDLRFDLRHDLFRNKSLQEVNQIIRTWNGWLFSSSLSPPSHFHFEKKRISFSAHRHGAHWERSTIKRTNTALVWMSHVCVWRAWKCIYINQCAWCNDGGECEHVTWMPHDYR